jgi:hypothetical protein
MRKIKYTKGLIEKISKESLSVRDMVDRLGLSISNGSIQMVYKLISKYEIDTSHFKNKKFIPIRKTNEEIFVSNSSTSRAVARKRILKENLIEYKCHNCGCDDQWMGKTMPLILDHINGINNDNRLENLRFLCSNCDSISDTYKSKNIGIDREREKKRKLIKKENDILLKEEKKRLEIESNRNKLSPIDFSKHGWRLEVASILECTPQYAGRYIKQNFQDIWENCKKHLK